METGEDLAGPSDGVLTVYFWHDDRNVESAGMWWLDDLDWPTDES